MPGVSPLLLGRGTCGFSLHPLPSKEGVRRGNLGAPSWRHLTMRPTCASSGNSLAPLGLAPPGSAVSSAPAGTSSAGNHPAPRAVSFLLRCYPSRDPRLRGAGSPEGGGTFLRKGAPPPFQTPEEVERVEPTLPVAALGLLACKN